MITFMILAYSTRIYMKSSEHNATNISSPICTDVLIFGKGALLNLFFLNTVANPINSQI